MPWGAAVGAGISLIGSSMQDNKNGGAGTRTTDKSPWLAAQPFITSNINSGQALENRYLANPQSPQQQAAANNIYGQSDYIRSLVPSLLGQLGQQQVGFDPSNPTAKPKAWSWQGLLGDGPNLNQGSLLTAQAADASSKKTGSDSGDFKQQGDIAWDPWNVNAGAIKAQATGGYGSFKYGDQPTPGTKAYYDMQQYKNYGGADPANIYGWNPPAALGIGGYGNGTAVDDGGAAAAVGSSANF